MLNATSADKKHDAVFAVTAAAADNDLEAGISTHPTLNDHYPYLVQSLSSCHDPKSILHFKSLINNDSKDLNLFFENLKTDPQDGLPIDQYSNPSLLKSRTKIYGKNKIPVTPPKSFFRLCLIALKDKIMIILTVAAIVSLALGLYETFGEKAELDANGKEIPRVAWVEGVAILVAVAIVVLVGAANDFQKEKQFAKLNAKKEDREIVVIRNANEICISIYDLLVGDLIKLETGDIVPADAVLVKGSFEVDESNITGETDTIKKFPIDFTLQSYDDNYKGTNLDINHDNDIYDPFLISGTRILSGLGQGIVTSVGPNSINGKAMMSLKVEPDPTSLTVRLDSLATGINKFAIIAGSILFIVLLIKFGTELTKGGRYYDYTGSEKGTKVLDSFITAVALIVVAVPEGLPLAVTVALAFATTRMAKDGNLVRILKACETMGGATAVCSDKTGTLTTNKMRVVRAILGSLEFNNTGTNHSLTDDLLDQKFKNSKKLSPVNETAFDIKEKLSDSIKEKVLTNIALNSSAFENMEEQEAVVAKKVEKKKWYSFSLFSPDFFGEGPRKRTEHEKFIGSKTETALMFMAQDILDMCGEKNLDALRKHTNLLHIKRIVEVIPFESSRKWAGVVTENNNGLFTFYIKGASEIVFGKCGTYLNNDNQRNVIDEEKKTLIFDKIEFYAKNALRTLVLAHKNYSSWPPKGDIFNEFIHSTNSAPLPKITIANQDVVKTHLSDYQESLTLDSLVGIQDPLREGVADAVKLCENAGVTVRMVTGDNIITARSIALGCGILTPSQLSNPSACMEGPTFRNLSHAERRKVIPELKVLARSSPEDKKILVENLKAMREVVAVTGDGTNDAPALRLADVGFSMGVSGTEVAREASDIVLMTDDFSAIVKAIKWGRCVSISIKKFIQFQLTVNITAVVLTFVSAVVSDEGESVLTAVQLLWVNLIMDTLAALALATDKPDDDILESKPDGRKAPLIAVSTWKMILGQSCTQLIVTFILHFVAPKIFYGNRELTNHEHGQMASMTFNAFVWLQYWKLFVTRKLNEADGIKKVRDRITMRNLNFFQHLFRNYYFIVISILIATIQIMIMFVGGTAFSITRQTGAQWGTAVISGMVSIPAGTLIRICPDEWAMFIFPSTVFKWSVYVLSFDFLRKSKKSPRSKNSTDSDSFIDSETDTANSKDGVKGNEKKTPFRYFSKGIKGSFISNQSTIFNKEDQEEENQKNYSQRNGHLALPDNQGGSGQKESRNEISSVTLAN
ncbi:calcium-transporting ATPase PMC1 [Ascoidea rubescens DSM 1968]|uniref:Calcium-transporting ATPase 2 n=1 Tax=Ascoidea rubescens DSM 1968 TaxID=1344418 RepID=A0A1D2VK73_9ASCO|nr:calcium-translocating P-type ATPase [Ascoidea rubescens DSM 1968]ODV62004.1 calcium-translocating P-type ATPase [Ascoidea rubescens DSM 1968]